jgi:cysteinyl-tRNA synthetase
MQWESPWGRGFPGWHLECSAMSIKYLGEQFDIHCGGIDHIPVHHTNELAQSEAATGKQPWVKYWLHNDFLVIDKGKMAKSSGEFLRMQTLIDKGFEPLVYRYFCLGAQYRQQLKFSLDGMEGAKNTFNRLKEKILELREGIEKRGEKVTESAYKKGKTNEYFEEFDSAINDDLNTPQALSIMWSVVRDEELSDKEKLGLLYKFDEVLGLGFKNFKREKINVPEEVMRLVREREKARGEKNWKKADELREKIKSLGYTMLDTPEGQKIKKIV